MQLGQALARSGAPGDVALARSIARFVQEAWKPEQQVSVGRERGAAGPLIYKLPEVGR